MPDQSKTTKEQALIAAVMEWAGDCEGRPGDPSDARLLKAIWTYEGDRTEPCPECAGDCGEPCARCTVARAHSGLDQFIADWLRERAIYDGIEAVLSGANP